MPHFLGKGAKGGPTQTFLIGVKNQRKLFCTKFFDNPSGHGRPRRKSWTSAPKSAFSCGPGGGEKLFDPWASGRKGQECPLEIRTKKFMFMLFFSAIDSLVRKGQIHCVSALSLVPREGLYQIHGQSLNTHRGKHRSGGARSFPGKGRKRGTHTNFFEEGSLVYCFFLPILDATSSNFSGSRVHLDAASSNAPLTVATQRNLSSDVPSPGH